MGIADASDVSPALGLIAEIVGGLVVGALAESTLPALDLGHGSVSVGSQHLDIRARQEEVESKR